MLRYFSYVCDNGDVFENLVKDEERDNPIDCPTCGARIKGKKIELNKWLLKLKS
jgi:predicted nucleic acid-binding Zn ribbon protein